MAGGDRKYGNKKKGAKVYAIENRQARNKKLRIARHLKKHPDDNTARAAR